MSIHNESEGIWARISMNLKSIINRELVTKSIDNPEKNPLLDQINELEFKYLNLKLKDTQQRFVNDLDHYNFYRIEGHQGKEYKNEQYIFKEYIKYLKQEIEFKDSPKLKTKDEIDKEYLEHLNIEIKELSIKISVELRRISERLRHQNRATKKEKDIVKKKKYNSKDEIEKIQERFNELSAKFDYKWISKYKEVLQHSGHFLDNNPSIEKAEDIFKNWKPLNQKDIDTSERAHYIHIHELMLMNYLNNASIFNDKEIIKSIYKMNRLTGRNQSNLNYYNKEMNKYFSDEFKDFLDRYNTNSEIIAKRIKGFKIEFDDEKKASLKNVKHRFKSNNTVEKKKQ